MGFQVFYRKEVQLKLNRGAEKNNQKKIQYKTQKAPRRLTDVSLNDWHIEAIVWIS